MSKKVSLFKLCLLVAIFVSMACSMPISKFDFCPAPNATTVSDIVGVWTARYDNHWIEDPEWTGQSHVNGVETITFLADGTYTHTFENDTYKYVNEPEPWSLDTSAVDAPKLKMENMRYFAAGETFDPGREKLSLLPEMGDLLYTYQGIYPERIDYPDSGFVNLYVRRCWFNVVLQQMIFNSRDPDMTAPASPMFYK